MMVSMMVQIFSLTSLLFIDKLFSINSCEGVASVHALASYTKASNVISQHTEKTDWVNSGLF